MRKQDIRTYKAKPKLAKKILKRKAKTSFKQTIFVQFINDICQTKSYRINGSNK